MSENSIISKELKNKRETDNEQQRNQLVDRNRDQDCGVDFSGILFCCDKRVLPETSLACLATMS